MHDAERFKEYAAAVPAVIEKHGGTYRVRGGDCEVLEGNWSPSRLVIIEFPDRAAAIAFYNDRDYEPLKALRHSASEGDAVIVEGYE